MESCGFDDSIGLDALVVGGVEMFEFDITNKHEAVIEFIFCLFFSACCNRVGAGLLGSSSVRVFTHAIRRLPRAAARPSIRGDFPAHFPGRPIRRVGDASQ